LSDKNSGDDEASVPKPLGAACEKILELVTQFSLHLFDLESIGSDFWEYAEQRGVVPVRIAKGIKGLISDGDKVLVLIEPSQAYDLPGGRVEEGESSLDCLRREIWEETGLEKVEITTSFVPWSFHKESGLLVRGFTLVCRYRGGSIVLSPEHSSFIWVSLNQLRSIDIYWKYGLDKFRFDFIEKSLERREAYAF
jgi:8-oxo-dGTP pyrophosphatase MutT (NUDIX family)